ncbi:MAG: C-terminal binding protein [Dehalococcoidia bacterium]|nr:C-terminal binding protein [Dehalococcoidia bacterium]MDW8119429.1 C-terminal binding protein [Chloroflexota bacterium]
MTSPRFRVVHLGPMNDRHVVVEREVLSAIGADLIPAPRPQTEDDILRHAGDADAIIAVTGPFTRRVLHNLKRCKVVVRTGVGVDTIDIPAATEAGIAIVNVPDLWTREVATHALAMLLALARRLKALDQAVRENRWRSVLEPPVPHFYGQTVGIVGLGRIGRAFARRARGFEFRIIAYDPYIPRSVFDEEGVEPVAFPDLLRQSDFVTIHTPLTPETRHMFNASTLRLMKPNAILVNTARGAVIDEKALIRALQERWIAGAALDVLEQEPPAPDNPLLQMDNVLLSPHAAYYSDKAVEGLPRRCAEEVARVLQGRMPLHLVNPAVGERLALRP